MYSRGGSVSAPNLNMKQPPSIDELGLIVLPKAHAIRTVQIQTIDSFLCLLPVAALPLQ